MRLIRGGKPGGKGTDKQADQQTDQWVGEAVTHGGDSATRGSRPGAQCGDPGVAETANLAEDETSAASPTETGPVGEADAVVAKGLSVGEESRSDLAERCDETELRGRLEAAQAELSSMLTQVQECENRANALSAERDAWAAKAQAAHDQFLRARSDLDGFRKRTERDLEDRITRGKADFILSLLEVLDNFDRALDAAQNSSAGGAFIKGVDMIRRQFVDALQREGVELIPSPVGQPMDPNLHDAVAAQEGGGEHGTVTDELRKGYLYKGTVLRPTRVRVIR